MAKFRLLGTYGSHSWGVGFWALLTGDPVNTDLVTLATDFYGAYETDILPHHGEAVELTECLVRYYSADDETVASIAATHAGSKTGATLPASAAVLLSWTIGSSFRGGKPRTYLPPPSSTEIGTAQQWDSAFTGPLVTDAASFLSDVNGLTSPNVSTLSLGCLRFFSGGAALAPPTFHPFTAVRVQDRICSQRRRLGRELL